MACLLAAHVRLAHRACRCAAVFRSCSCVRTPGLGFARHPKDEHCRHLLDRKSHPLTFQHRGKRPSSPPGDGTGVLAEGEGFEPSVRLPVQRFSSAEFFILGSILSCWLVPDRQSFRSSPRPVRSYLSRLVPTGSFAKCLQALEQAWLMPDPSFTSKFRLFLWNVT